MKKQATISIAISIISIITLLILSIFYFLDRAYIMDQLNTQSDLSRGLMNHTNKLYQEVESLKNSNN